MARPRKYATVDELQQTEVRLVEQIRANSPNGELKRIARGMERFEKIAEPLERIVAREEQVVEKRQAWAMVKADIRAMLRIPSLEGWAERFAAAVIGGLGFAIASKVGEVVGLWRVLTEHAPRLTH